MNVPTLIDAVLDALRSSAAVPEQRDMMVLQAIMMILSDNWTPMEAVRGPLQVYIAAATQGDVTREEFSKTLASKFARRLGDDANVSLELVSVCREDSDPLSLTEQVCARHFPRIINGIMDYAGTPDLPFYQAFRGALVGFIGEWLDSLSQLFMYGAEALPGMLHHFAQLVIRIFVERSPEHAQTAVVAAPMAVMLLQRYLAEYQAQQQQQQQQQAFS